tara:strand:+ start:3640 stop:4212 length:573 start_codon:yes stop_codon:yes gene_type:complete
MPWKYNNTIIRAGKSWRDDNGITHPATWMRWTDAEKKAAGLVWEDAPASEAPFDNRFYWGRQADGTLIPRSLTDINEVDENGDAILDLDGNQLVTKGLKTLAIEQVKVEAGAKLVVSDWMVVKASEVSSYTVPSAMLTYRAAVRTASNTIETAITNASDLAAFMALYDVPVDANGDPTGNAPINDWPDEI